MGKFKEYWNVVQSIVDKHPKGKPLDKEGRFYPDPTPHAPPPGNSFVADIDMFEVMKQRLRSEGLIRQQMEDDETEEEFNDFSVEDESEPFSPYEEIMEQVQMDGPVLRPTYNEVNLAVARENQADVTNARRSANAEKNAPPKEAAPKPEPKAPEAPQTGLPKGDK